MELADYPLHVAHQYEMSQGRRDQELARFVSRQSRASLERMQGLSRKRIDDPALLGHRPRPALIERLGIERIAISAFGVREGLLLAAMPPEVRDLDLPLIEGCEALTAPPRHPLRNSAARLEAWLSPTFEQFPPMLRRARSACCWPPPAVWPTSARACTPTIARTSPLSRCCARRWRA